MGNSEKKPPRPKILIADDLLENRELLRRTIEPEGYDVFLVPGGDLALDVAQKINPDLILLDIQMPNGMDGFTTCDRLKENPVTRDIPVVFISVENETRSLVEGFKRGSVDYIVKPFAKEEVLARIKTHVDLFRLRKELLTKNRELEDQIHQRAKAERERQEARDALEDAGERLSFISEQEAKRWGISAFIGRSATLRTQMEKVKRLQETKNMSVLITGENGTGKELFSRAIHFGSNRAKGPFVALNCSAIPKDLAESLLFGHIKGSFSGATANQKGHFEMAHQGTLFLDEVGDLPLDIQAKFLRVLEEGTFIPVGAGQAKKVDVRILAATNRDLETEIQNGNFRKDLYFRLAQYKLKVPALRERKDDIPLLAEHFVHLFASEMGRPSPHLAEEALEDLQNYSFPGNIRELKNMMERAVIDCVDNLIVPENLDFLKPLTPTPAQSFESGDEDSHGSESIAMDLIGMTAEEQRIIQHIRKQGSLNNTECRNLLGVNIDRAYYLLRKMHKSGVLKQIGQQRGTRYVLS